MIAAVFALSFSLFGPPPLPPAVRRYHSGGWLVVRRTDRFTGTVSCSVGRGGMEVDREALMFDLGRSDTPVVARLDSGPPSRIDATSGLDPIQVSPDVALYNPSGGKVALPLDRVEGARTVWLRAGPTQWPLHFDVSGVAAALNVAKAAGCPAPTPAGA